MKLVCISCPRGCGLEVDRTSGGVSVKGHGCPRGKAYGEEEATNPKRIVTGLVKVAGTRKPLPVKTRVAIPKAKISDVTNLLANTTVLPPKRIGDVIVADVCGTGVDVVASANR